MKEPTVDGFSALIGIDWADKTHDICEMPEGLPILCYFQ